MKATTNKALALLGEVAQLNEEIMEFMIWCYTDTWYDGINSLEHEIMDERFRAVLWADADIRLEHHHAGNILGEAYRMAIENNDLKTAKKIKMLSDRLISLTERLEEQKSTEQ